MNSDEKWSGTKYIIKANFTIDGVVEKHDVIGAIFGQTEGLFPKEFELRELQKSGKIGRININLKSAKDKTTGNITLSSSLDRAETAIVAAAMETVDRVGPCDSSIAIEGIADVRSEKRRQIVQRAKELMTDWVVKETHDIEKLLKEVQKVDKKIQPVHYGRERLTATPDIDQMDEVIVVEGRADIINLLKSGVKGAIALEGVKIPNTIKKLVKKKKVTAFLDGDRGGDLILKELMQVAKPEYITRAPMGKGVEDLTPEEIKTALAERVPIEQIIVKEEILPIAEELKGTLEAVLMTREGTQVDRIPVSELVEKVKESKDVNMIIFDGIITSRLLDAVKEKKINTLIGARIAEGLRIPKEIDVQSLDNLK